MKVGVPRKVGEGIAVYKVPIAVKRLSSKEEPSFFSEAGGTELASPVGQAGFAPCELPSCSTLLALLLSSPISDFLSLVLVSIS